MKKFLLLFGIASILLNSCSKDDFAKTNCDNIAITTDPISSAEKEKYMETFASTLSKAVYDRKDVREFLKKESIKQFDKNYDVLYYLVKDEPINGTSFRDILISYSSADTIEKIEANIPLLNIFVSKIEFFDIHPENLNTDDNEIPVAVSKDSTTSFYLNGKDELSIKKGEVPDFHVFVVNENSRVVAPSSQALRSTGVKSIKFKSPNYDGSLTNNQPILKSTIALADYIGQKAIDAFSYFNKDDGSINQKAFQRDFVYYGITPQNQTGSLNRSVSEYISFIEVNPNAYFTIADQRNTTFNNDDPYNNNSETTQTKRGLSEAELLDRLWTKGAYNFRFEIITSTQEQAQVVYVPLKPDQLWNFNIEDTYVHSTWFRHSKHTYRIDPNKFKSKRIFLDKMVSLGKWDISAEALYRYIQIYEEDASANEDVTETYDMTKALKLNFNGNSKTSVGLKDIGTAESGYSSAVESSTTEKVTKSITTKRLMGSDPLGKVQVYFYEPLIDNIFSDNGSKSYVMHTYNTGSIEFGIAVK